MERGFVTVAVTGIFLMTGCTTPSDSPLDKANAWSTVVVNTQEVDLSEVNCLAMPVSSDKKRFSVKVPFNNEYLKLPTGRTPFVAYRIPQGHYTITVDSYVVNPESKRDAEIFYPEIALINDEQVVTERIGGEKVKYFKPDVVKPEGLSLSFETSQTHASCMLVYTTDEQRLGKTRLMNEGKEYAKVHGVVPPPLPDTYATHGDVGHLSISLKGPSAIMSLPSCSGTDLLPISDSFSE
ncbi:hypothetical protein ACH42_12220 [Endozoicomonas sp. (ex Bugula neritina AB1)]|nr:hypothetical protein ACH42_12220 [Endozoicomonas sp. (ex Bugula neritina AB1)]